MTPRSPEGDWLGTPHLRFERHGSLARCVVDRPEKRNAMTPAMYFGLRRAVDVVNRDPAARRAAHHRDGRRVHPRRRHELRSYDDDWTDLGDLLHMDVTPFDAVRHSAKPVVSAVNGIAQGGGMMIAMLSDVAVASDRATFRVTGDLSRHRGHALRADPPAPGRHRPGPRSAAVRPAR